ncbi:mucin-22 [Eurosta solidaginis]|uniref:mucin-22 n=1 Tax=Eurosta solidaginis TaxID=178769 RepID=UPI003530DCC5
MLLKIQLICCLAILAKAQNSIEQQPADALVNQLNFETSHKHPDDVNIFQTSHKIPRHTFLPDSDLDLLQGTMNLLPTKERPELNPVLSALINEDVMKSIEAKRAIEEKELEQIKAELEAERKQEEKAKRLSEKAAHKQPSEEVANYAALTTAAPMKKIELDEDFNTGFVDQSINLDAAGSESNKKSRIEIKKGPNGQDYEYEYVYYYEDEDDAKAAEAPAKADERGKSRYSNIERTTSAPSGNSLVSNKAKGRSSNVADVSVDEVEPERLPANTRFPNRGKNVDAQPTPALDSLENAAEKKKISVKRPSLELVDSATFNTDEKQVKATRNGDTETKSAIVIEQEQAAAAAVAAAAQAAEKKDAGDKQRRQPTVGSVEESATVKDAEDGEVVEQTTLSMQKAALDLYAILAHENFNMDMTTDTDAGITTVLPDTTDEGAMTTFINPESSSSTTSTTTTTTTEAPTTTTTTTTTTPAPGHSLYGGKRAGLNGAGRNRFKLNKGGKSETSTTTTEAPASEAPKTGKNRFSRPSIGGRTRPGGRTTTAAPAPVDEDEEVAAPKEVKPVSTGFGRGRPRNRFNLRSTTTTEKSSNADNADVNEDVAVASSTTARSLRGGRPTLGLRGRSRTTTVKPASTAEEHKDEENAGNTGDEKPAPVPVKPASRFARPGAGNRLLTRGKLARTTETPAVDDSTAESSHHNDVKGEEEGGADNTEKTAEAENKHTTSHGLNRLKSRPHLHKTESSKPKVAPAPVAPRKVNPLLAKRRLPLGHSTTETPAEEDNSTAVEESKTEEESAPAAISADAPNGDDADSAKNDGAADDAEATTKQQARGLGLLMQRRRLPLRKPGTIL